MRLHYKLFAPVLISLTTLGWAQGAAKKADAKAAPAAAKSTEAKPAAAPAPAAAPKAAEAPASAEKAVDFSAKDVWDKELFERDDNKVLVIQDRKYNKSGRLEVGADLGMTAATAFYNTYTAGGRAAYYFNEYWGIQAFGNYSFSNASREKDQLDNYLDESGFASTKEYKQPKLFAGVGVLWNPIYGKFAWFRSRIIHFDIYAGAGVSYLTTESSLDYFSTTTGRRYKGEDDQAFGSLLNLGMRIFLSKNLAWTTEIRNNIYKARYAETRTGGDTASIGAKDVWSNNFQFVTGVSYMFNIGGY